jgi:hypothetical protein
MYSEAEWSACCTLRSIPINKICSPFLFRNGRFYFPRQQPLVGQGLLIIEASRSHSDTPHSVGLQTSDQPDAKTSISQQTTLTGDIHTPRGIRTRNPSKRGAADPLLRPRGHGDRRSFYYTTELYAMWRARNLWLVVFLVDF